MGKVLAGRVRGAANSVVAKELRSLKRARKLRKTICLALCKQPRRQRTAHEIVLRHHAKSGGKGQAQRWRQRERHHAQLTSYSTVIPAYTNISIFPSAKSGNFMR
jgi:hypothetical protein